MLQPMRRKDPDRQDVNVRRAAGPRYDELRLPVFHYVQTLQLQSLSLSHAYPLTLIPSIDTLHLQLQSRRVECCVKVCLSFYQPLCDKKLPLRRYPTLYSALRPAFYLHCLA